MTATATFQRVRYSEVEYVYKLDGIEPLPRSPYDKERRLVSPQTATVWVYTDDDGETDTDWSVTGPVITGSWNYGDSSIWLDEAPEWMEWVLFDAKERHAQVVK